MDVSQEAFQQLEARVAALEGQSRQTESMFGYIFTALHELDLKIDHVDGRFDSVDRKLDEVIRRLP